MENLPGPVLGRGYAEILVEDSHTCRRRMAGSTGQTRRHNHTQTRWAAIKILAQTKTRTYPEITTKIIDSAFALGQRDSPTTLHWVPSHT